ncbi:MAG: hypothetical protein ACRD3C_13440 [Vicinamibacterales bacterium]
MWRFIVEGLALMGAGLLLLALWWAAVERGRAHQQWARVRRKWHDAKSARVVDWCAAVGTMVGWV